MIKWVKINGRRQGNAEKLLYLCPDWTQSNFNPMHRYPDDAGLRKAGLDNGTSIYELESDGLLNHYYILSSEGTRHLMASPEVVGFDSYISMAPATCAGLNLLKSKGLTGQTNILTILRGGLNYPLEECCHKTGVRVGSINFVSCERIIRDGVITGLDIKYEKLHPVKDCILMIGDIIASGDTMRLCLAKVAERFKTYGGSLRKIIFFTIGGTKAIDIMEKMTGMFRSMWPGFEGFECFFYEGIFSVYENFGVTGVNTPDIDFGWQDGIISPEFRSHVLNDANAIFEKCIIYDGGARRYEISAHCDEVLDYWNSLLEAAPASDFNAFIAEKIGYGFPIDYAGWLQATRLGGIEGAEKLYRKEQEFIFKERQRKLEDICRTRINEFSERMKSYKQ